MMPPDMSLEAAPCAGGPVMINDFVGIPACYQAITGTQFSFQPGPAPTLPLARQWMVDSPPPIEAIPLGGVGELSHSAGSCSLPFATLRAKEG